MQVFGDRARARDPRAMITELAAALADLPRLRGLARHAALVGAFLEASELAQGLADAACPEADARDPASDAALDVLVALARQIDASWAGRPAVARPDLDAIAACALPDSIVTRRAEGHAFYALYPEAYLAAARAAGPGARRVIGIRSIGAGLAAIVAAATGAPRPATVRPRGDPYRREVIVAPELAREWIAPPAMLAIVDEGPGRSGSSFGAVADLLEDRGIAPAAIECFPSHRGELGPAAGERHRARWRTIRRHVVEADALLVESGRLAAWIAALVGPIDGPLEDLSAGAWRARSFARESDWPASVTYQERRKLRARAGGSTWLARFVGLGSAGDRALACARALHTAGFTPRSPGCATASSSSAGSTARRSSRRRWRAIASSIRSAATSARARGCSRPAPRMARRSAGSSR